MFPEPISTTIATSLATHLITQLLDATTRRVREKFAGKEEQQALQAALKAGLQAALESLPLDRTEFDHFELLFGQFLEHPAVVDDLIQILDPRTDVTIDLGLLQDEFRVAGFDPNALALFDFNTFIIDFLKAFFDAAAGQKALQGTMEIKLLRLLVENTAAMAEIGQRTATATEQTAAATTAVANEFAPTMERILQGQARTNELSELTGQITTQGFDRVVEALETSTSIIHKAGYDIIIQDSGTVVIGDRAHAEISLDTASLRGLQHEITRLRQSIEGKTPTPTELNALRQRYCQHLIRWFERLTFQGMMRSAQAISLPLEDVYVELRAVAEVPEAADTFSVEERRLLLEIDDGDQNAKQELLRQFDTLRRERWSRAHLERKSIMETLYNPDQRAIVILGDPGSGKSTLLHLLALVFACGPQVVHTRLHIPPQEADRLPIFVPLAAFDDMRRANPGLTLVDFLPRYYDRRRGIAGLAHLFQHALESGRALVLLDGLDEVLETATRQYVAGQVSALINEWGGRGNRFVITSRFVGYREAPINGNLPHLSVLDFGETEIKTFIHQWARAYERFAAGGQESPESLRRAYQAEKDLLLDVESIPSVHRLAANPLMLTMLALLRRQVGRLPHRRIELYKRYIDTMIDNWVEARSLGERENALDLLDPHLTESLLIPLAYWLQANQPSGTASGREILEALTDICLEEDGFNPQKVSKLQRKSARQKAQRFLHEMRTMNGLIVERGYDAYGFLHLTFQEYFAGRALAQMEPTERWRAVQPHLHDPRWREPILLCAGQLGVVEKRRSQVSTFVRQVLDNADLTEPDLHRNLLLALSMAGDDINLEPALLEEITQRAINCLPTQVYAFAADLIHRLGQLIANIAVGQRTGVCEGCLSVIWQAGDWQLRKTAVQALSSFTTDFVLRAAVLERLEDPDNTVRRAAVEVLAGEVGSDTEVRAAVLVYLEDPSGSVRQAVVEALAGQVGSDTEVRAAVLAHLEDPEWSVRQAVVEALAGLVGSDTEVRAAVLARLEDRNDPYGYIRRAAVKALAGLVGSDMEVRAAVLARLDDQSGNVRRAVVKAFIAFDSTKDLICTRWGDLTAWLLLEIDHRYYPGETEQVEQLRRRLGEIVGYYLPTDPALVEKLLAWLESPRASIRLGAVMALVNWPGGVPKEVLAPILASLDDDRDLASYPARLEAASPLINRDTYSQTAVDVCLEALDYGTQPWEDLPESVEIRKQAAMILGKLEPLRYEARVYERLRQVMFNDQEASVRDAAYNVLVRLAQVRGELEGKAKIA